MQGRVAVVRAGVGGRQLAPSHSGGHTGVVVVVRAGYSDRHEGTTT